MDNIKSDKYYIEKVKENIDAIIRTIMPKSLKSNSITTSVTKKMSIVFSLRWLKRKKKQTKSTENEWHIGKNLKKKNYSLR